MRRDNRVGRVISRVCRLLNGMCECTLAVAAAGGLVMV